MALSDAVTALWKYNVSDHYSRTTHHACVYVWSNRWDLLHLDFLSSFFFFLTHAQTRFGRGACKRQPAPNLCNDTKIAVAALLFHGCLSAHRAALHVAVISKTWRIQGWRSGRKTWPYRGTHCIYHLGNDWFTWLCEVKESNARSLGLILQMLW